MPGQGNKPLERGFIDIQGCVQASSRLYEVLQRHSCVTYGLRSRLLQDGRHDADGWPDVPSSVEYIPSVYQEKDYGSLNKRTHLLLEAWVKE